jgi:hypothetical protein
MMHCVILHCPREWVGWQILHNVYRWHLLCTLHKFVYHTQIQQRRPAVSFSPADKKKNKKGRTYFLMVIMNMYFAKTPGNYEIHP